MDEHGRRWTADQFLHEVAHHRPNLVVKTGKQAFGMVNNYACMW